MNKNKQNKLDRLKKKMQADEDLPLYDLATNLVFGEGDPDAEVVFIGEAPGYKEDMEGRPFMGDAGHILKRLLLESGMTREGVYITNLIHYRPPGNRDPSPPEIRAFSPYLEKIVRIVEPKLIVALGRFAAREFTDCFHINECHGKLSQEMVFGLKVWVLNMFHPAAAVRKKEIKAMFEQDFKKIPELLKKGFK